MASRNAMIGTGVALAGLSGLAVAAVSSGTDAATPLRPTADTVETQTQIVRTVENRTKRLKARKTDDGRTVVSVSRSRRASSGAVRSPAVATGTTPAATASSGRGGTDDGPKHDLNDDRGGAGEIEPGDDKGGRGGVEPGDDKGARGEIEPGDDKGGRGSNSGRGGEDD